MRRALLAAMPLAAVAAALAGPASASSVTPTEVPGNPTCQDLGYDFGFKPTEGPPTSGQTYTQPLTSRSVVVNHDGTTISSWTANFGVDAIIVKGGNNANVYAYPQDVLGDTDLVSPANNGGQVPALSHVTFCWNAQLEVVKTATPAYSSTASWTISKSVDRPAWTMFRGDTATSVYTVGVDRTDTPGNWTVQGTIAVTNPAATSQVVNSVTDTISGLPALDVPVDCSVAFPYTMAAGETLNCTYGPVALPDGSDRTNTAHANAAGGQGQIDDGLGTAPISFAGVVPTQAGPQSVKVTDPVDGQGVHAFETDGSFSYPKTFTCDQDAGTFTNTATMTDIDDGLLGTASADVTVTCEALEVTKTANTSLDRKYAWQITKAANPGSVLGLAANATGQVGYTVGVNATATDSNHQVSGTVTVHNPSATHSATLLGLTDAISGIDAQVALNCGVEFTFPTVLEPGQDLVCGYSTPLPDGTAPTNTATATLQNTHYPLPVLDVIVPQAVQGGTDFVGTAPVDFTKAAVTATDETVNVTDSLQGVLGTVTAGVDALPKSFAYTRTVGPVACDSSTVVPNTATFVTTDTAATGSASASVTVTGAACVPTITVTPPPPAVVDQGRPAAKGALRVTKTGPKAATAGQIVTYRITVRNTGKAAATKVVLKDLLPSGYTLSGKVRGGSLAKGAVVWSVGTLRAGASRTVTASFRVDRSVSGRRCNTATASASGLAGVRATACTRIAAVAGVVEPSVTG